MVPKKAQCEEIGGREGVPGGGVDVDHPAPEVEGVVAVVGKQKRMRHPAFVGQAASANGSEVQSTHHTRALVLTCNA